MCFTYESNHIRHVPQAEPVQIANTEAAARLVAAALRRRGRAAAGQGALAQSACGRGPHPGAIAQLGEHLLCKQGVVGSIPTGSTFRSPLVKGRHLAAHDAEYGYVLANAS